MNTNSWIDYFRLFFPCEVTVKIKLVRIEKTGVYLTEENVSDNATVEEALKELSVTVTSETGLAVFTRRVTGETVLKEGDRLEIVAPLICDVKKVRSERAIKQGDIRVVTCGRHGGRRRVVASES